MTENRMQMSGRGLVLALLLLSAAVLAWLFWARGQAMSRQTPAVVLLPFLSSSPETQYYADGLTMELISSLSKVEKLRVTSWNSAARWRGKAADLRGLRENLQAAAVVDGAVTKTGDRLQVTVKLIDANTGAAIWSDSLDRPEREVFQIQERIAKGIVYALNVPMRVDPQRILVPVRTESMEAYDNYLRARAALSLFSVEGVNQSAEFAEKAVAADAKFSPAYGLLAANYALLRPLDRENLTKAKAFARKALDLDSSSGEAHSALGMALGLGEWDWAAARVELERAVQWAPNSADAHAAFALGYLLPFGDLEGADIEAAKAVELDRYSFFGNDVSAEVRQSRDRAQEALQYTQAAAAICPSCPRVRRHPAFSGWDAVNQAIAAHELEIAFLQVDPAYAALRRDPQFAEALKRVKLGK